MKKIFLFLSAISFIAISSCSSNDDGPASEIPTADVLVKKAVYQQADAQGFNFTIDYVYSGNKLVKEQYNNGDVSNYFYTGDLITKIEYVVGGELYIRETFAYNTSGKLTEYRHRFLTDSADEILNYTYNSNNTVTQTNVTYPSDSATLTYTNGEISKEVQVGGITYNYTYDDKNSPMKNVTGYAEIANAVIGDFETHGRAKNIILIVSQPGNNNYMTNSFVYNTSGYPTKVTSAAILDDEESDSIKNLIVTYTY